MTKSEAHQLNIDAAQRELDSRAAQGEDVSHLRVCQKTAAIVPARNPLILNQAQAEAVYSAMCALNNIACLGGSVNLPADSARDAVSVYWDDAMIEVKVGALGSRKREVYESQHAFATAYGLQAPTAITQPLQAGETYWVAFPNTGDVSRAVWGSGEADEERLEDGRCYRTEADAWAAVKAAT